MKYENMKFLDCIIVKFAFRLVSICFSNFFFYLFLSNINFVDGCNAALCLISFAVTERTPCPVPVGPDSAALDD